MKSYLIGNIICGVEITSIKGENAFYISIIQKIKDKLHLINFHIINDLKDLTKYVNKNTPIHLIINNSKVLSKQITTIEKNSIKNVKKAFNHINISEFYYQANQFNEDQYLLSVCRKTEISKYIEILNSLNYFSIQISLKTHHVLDLIKNKIIDRHILHYSNGSLFQNINSMNENIEFNEINGLRLDKYSTLGSLGAIASFLDISSLQTNLNEAFNPIKEEFNYKKIYNISKIVCLSIIFILLIINALLYTQLWNKYNYMVQEQESIHINKEKLIELEQQINSVEKIIKIKQQSTSMASHLIQLIIHSVPSTLVLKKMDYKPLSHKLKPDKPILTNNNIIIQGTTIKREEFSKWISSLKKIELIDEINILNFKDINYKNSEFLIEIKLYENK